MPLFHSFSCCLAEELFPWSCLLPSLLHDLQLMCHGRADLCWWRCCKKSSESSISWNLKSILRVWPSKSNKHRSETEITVSLVLQLYCPSHDRSKKTFSIIFQSQNGGGYRDWPGERNERPRAAVPPPASIVSGSVAPGSMSSSGDHSKKTHQKRMVKKQCKLTGCNTRWNVPWLSWLVTTKNVKGWWLRWIIVQVGLVVTNIALAGWNLRFTSLAAATIRCPTSSKVTRFLRSHVAMPFEYHQGFLSTWASSYVFFACRIYVNMLGLFTIQEVWTWKLREPRGTHRSYIDFVTWHWHDTLSLEIP